MPVHVDGKLAAQQRRFWAKVEIAAEDECWWWTGAKLPPPRLPYGMTKVGRRSEGAHRRMFDLFCGAIPKGGQVCHSCDNPSCVNPGHLWIGTPKDNNEDMRRKGRASGVNWAARLARSPRQPCLKRLAARQKSRIVGDPRTGHELASVIGVHRSTIDRVRKKAGMTLKRGGAAHRARR